MLWMSIFAFIYRWLREVKRVVPTTQLVCRQWSYSFDHDMSLSKNDVLIPARTYFLFGIPLGIILVYHLHLRCEIWGSGKSDSFWFESIHICVPGIMQEGSILLGNLRPARVTHLHPLTAGDCNTQAVGTQTLSESCWLVDQNSSTEHSSNKGSPW